MYTFFINREKVYDESRLESSFTMHTAIDDRVAMIEFAQVFAFFAYQRIPAKAFLLSCSARWT